MTCIDCGGAVTVFSPGKPHERSHCHQCGAQVFKGLLVNRKDWDRWINGEAGDLVGRSQHATQEPCAQGCGFKGERHVQVPARHSRRA